MKNLETKTHMAYPLIHGVLNPSCEKVETEFVSGIILNDWGKVYRMDSGWCFPIKFCKDDSEVEGKVWCRKSEIFKP